MYNVIDNYRTLPQKKFDTLAGHPFIPGPQFGKNDPRRAFTLARTDFRTHFALVCGAESCPPINFYDAENLDY
jgi:hypothetical protein